MKIAFLRPNLGGQRSNDAIEPLGFAVLSGLTDRKKHEILNDKDKMFAYKGFKIAGSLLMIIPFILVIISFFAK